MNRILKIIACMALMTLICGCAFAASTLELPASLTVIREEAFAGDTSIETVIVPEGVTAIESKAFANSGLSLIQLPSTLKSIAPDAFEGVSGFKAVAAEGTWAYTYCTENNIPIQNWVQETPASHFKYDEEIHDGVKGWQISGANSQIADVVVPEEIDGRPVFFISPDYYEENEALRSIYYPDSLVYTEVWESQKLSSVSFASTTQADFAGIKTLESVVVREGIERANYDPSIDYSAFKDCTNLKSIIISDDVQRIENYAFQNCTSLTEIMLPKSLEDIRSGAFDGCINLQEIEGAFADNWVYENTFRNCKKLESLVLLDNVYDIDATAFEGCENLTLTVMPGSDAIEECDELGLKYTVAEYGFGKLNDKAELEFTGYAGTNPNLIIPSEAYGLPVTTVADYALRDNETITSVTISEGITSIDYNAFYNCANLKNVALPDNLTSIGESAFGSCDSLEKINLPDGIETIEGSTFYWCKALKAIEIPDSVTSIGYYAFAYCEALKKIDLPDGLTTIGERAFEHCLSVSEVIIPDSVTSIGDSAFTSCAKLSKVKLPAGLTKIDSGTFFNCESLAHIDIPNTVTEIAYGAFTGCEAMKNVTIPASVKVIGDHAFSSNQIYIEKIAILNKTADITIGSMIVSDWKDPTIYCYRYSGADAWAQSQGFEIVYLDDNDFASVGSVSLPASMRVAAGKTDWILLSIFPDLGDLDVTWISKNGDVATVSNGLVTAKSKGEAEIMVMVGNKTATMPLTVYLELTSFDLSDTEITIEAGASYQLSCINIAPEGADAVFSYESSNTLAASVDANGMITASAIGDAVITVTSDSGVEQTCIVHVVRPAT